ncbi:polysaccharide biosynthesis protein [Aquimarina sp. U1-2]|uniref:O-unit flippase-like protein n=1 Tax=Aquimarina sp. U1-2 TaxID=2823141 RepID=UPI001AECD54B|nr:O-unit flippase-like protein [Aquimarina sp. U1-2]MBP2833879.1 polysaccharide biosynthesis protein [Aquimarina sp. U1-2]
MSIAISRKDVLWSYFSQFFSIASGLITLPLILKLLSTEEIGLNYLMLTVGSLVILFDFGFTPQFSRNISYVFSGANNIKKEGIDDETVNGKVNYRILATMISTAQLVYRRLAFIVLLTMLTVGSWYIYEATEGFTSVNNSFLIWFVYSLSVFFNIYYSYYNSLLIGKGLIMESRKANVYSKSFYIALTFLLLYLGTGLLGVAVANLIAPFIGRFLSYRFFFTKELKLKISEFDIEKKEKLDLFNIIWYNSKKLGLVFLGSYAINKLSMFLAGLYLSLEQVASYGLMIQLASTIGTISSTLFIIYQPRFSALRIEKKKKLLLHEFSFSMNIYYLLYILGSVLLVFLGPVGLELIGSNAELPERYILSMFLMIIFLEGNHANFATFIVTKNDIPFVKSALISGGVIGLCSYLSLELTNFDILGLIVVQGLTQLAYANWKWPSEVCKEFNISYIRFLKLGGLESFNKIKYLLNISKKKV